MSTSAKNKNKSNVTSMNASQATIESLNNRFLMKMNLIINLFEDLIKISPKELNKEMMINFKCGEIISLSDEYKIAVAPAVAAYYLNCLDKTENIKEVIDDKRNKMIEAELAALNEFRSAVLVGNFIIRLETFVKAADSIITKLFNIKSGEESIKTLNYGTTALLSAARLDPSSSAQMPASLISHQRWEMKASQEAPVFKLPIKTMRELQKKLEIVRSIQLNTLINCSMMRGAGAGKIGINCEDCGGELKMSYESAHLICMNCGLLIEICGSEYEKSSSGNVNSVGGLGDGAAGNSLRGKGRGNSSGSNSGENRHLNKCLDFLFAMKECPLTDIEEEKIKKELSMSRYDLNSIYCVEMRTILKELKLTVYNPYIPWLIKKFTGRGPPQFTIEEKNVIKNKFNRLAWWYKKLLDCNVSGGENSQSDIKSADFKNNDNRLSSVPRSIGEDENTNEKMKNKLNEKENLSHYYYFIYKIVEKEFCKDGEKLELLNFIHLQSAETIKKNDKILQKIGEAAAEIGEDLTFQKTKKFRK
jgi:hypothetical protein